MGYVPGFKYDVFISYAHADNYAETSSVGWVTQFAADLRLALKQRLGGSKALEIFHDVREARGGNYRLNELSRDVQASAVMLAVLSPGYVEFHEASRKPFTLLELEAFFSSGTRAADLFAIQILPFYKGTGRPKEIADLVPKKFWYETDGLRMPLSHLQSVEYRQCIHDLAEHLNARLRRKRLDGSDNPATHGLAAAAGAKIGSVAQDKAASSTGPVTGKVLLAQVTDDLEDDREQVRRYLEQFGVQVLPGDSYPQHVPDFQAAVQSDLARADLFVQLLGPWRGRRPADLAEGYPRAQLETARAARAPILQWRHPELKIAEVADADHRALLQGPEVLALGLEAFKAEIVRRLRRIELENADKAASGSGSMKKGAAPSFVFINADRTDLEVARALGDEFKRNKQHVSFPILDGSAEEVREDLESNIVDCDALVLVYGKARPVWVRGQLRLYTKLLGRRHEPPRVLALYTGPPEVKPDVEFSIPDLIEIDCRRQFDASRVQEILSRLNG